MTSSTWDVAQKMNTLAATGHTIAILASRCNSSMIRNVQHAEIAKHLYSEHDGEGAIFFLLDLMILTPLPLLIMPLRRWFQMKKIHFCIEK